MARYNPSKIWCAVLVREMRYFKSGILHLRSFVLMYPFLWCRLSESSEGLFTLLVNLVLTYERVFWKTHSSCNQAVSSRLLSFCSTATHLGDVGEYPDQPSCFSCCAASGKKVRSDQAVKCLIAGGLFCGKKCCKYASFLLDSLADGISF